MNIFEFMLECYKDIPCDVWGKDDKIHFSSIKNKVSYSARRFVFVNFNQYSLKELQNNNNKIMDESFCSFEYCTSIKAESQIYYDSKSEYKKSIVINRDGKWQPMHHHPDKAWYDIPTTNDEYFNLMVQFNEILHTLEVFIQISNFIKALPENIRFQLYADCVPTNFNFSLDL